MALHRGERVSADSLLIDGSLFVLLAASAIRDAKRRSHGNTVKSPFEARRLTDLEAAYAQPTFDEYRRAIAPLRNRGFGRLALVALLPIAMILLAPHVGIGVAYLIALGGCAAIFLALHYLIDL